MAIEVASLGEDKVCSIYEAERIRLAIIGLRKKTHSSVGLDILTAMRVTMAAKERSGRAPARTVAHWFLRGEKVYEPASRFATRRGMNTNSLAYLANASSMIDALELAMNDWVSAAVKRNLNEREQDLFLAPFGEGDSRQAIAQDEAPQEPGRESGGTVVIYGRQRTFLSEIA